MWPFKKKEPEEPLWIRNHNAEAEALEAEFEAAVHIDGCKPSVEGNKVVLDKPELESQIERMCEGFTFIFKTGSSELQRNKKIFKNDQGQVHRIEVFKPFCVRFAQG